MLNNSTGAARGKVPGSSVVSSPSVRFAFCREDRFTYLLSLLGLSQLVSVFEPAMLKSWAGGECVFPDQTVAVGVQRGR